MGLYVKCVIVYNALVVCFIDMTSTPMQIHPLLETGKIYTHRIQIIK